MITGYVRQVGDPGLSRSTVFQLLIRLEDVKACPVHVLRRILCVPLLPRWLLITAAASFVARYVLHCY